MTMLLSVEPLDLDMLDERIVHGSIVEPRAPFRVLADVVGASPQTVARRYRRLQELAGPRVTGRVVAPLAGWVDWYVRMHCVPGAAAGLAGTLVLPGGHHLGRSRLGRCRGRLLPAGS
jgi:hypothetical protein